MVKWSCKGCTNRYVGCHSQCEDYQNDVLRRHELKEKVYAAKEKERIFFLKCHRA